MKNLLLLVATILWFSVTGNPFARGTVIILPPARCASPGAPDPSWGAVQPPMNGVLPDRGTEPIARVPAIAPPPRDNVTTTVRRRLTR